MMHGRMNSSLTEITFPTSRKIYARYLCSTIFGILLIMKAELNLNSFEKLSSQLNRCFIRRIKIRLAYTPVLCMSVERELGESERSLHPAN
jgi:hypothetical protein